MHTEFFSSNTSFVKKKIVILTRILYIFDQIELDNLKENIQENSLIAGRYVGLTTHYMFNV